MKRLLVAAVLAATLAAMPFVAGSGQAAPRTVAMLPDPAQSPPKLIQVEQGANGGWHIGFLSAVVNAGRGPLTIHGHRASTAEPNMTADQLIARSDGSVAAGVPVGTMQFVSSPTHNHWHLLDFERYELRRAGDAGLVGISSKRGFCLTDTAHDAGDKPFPGEKDDPVYREQCGLNDPNKLEVTEGISVGWMDVYDPFREGQFVDITGVPAGRYLVVNRVNYGRRIREVSRANNASTVLVRISWPNGSAAKPVVDQLASCFYSIRCYDKAPRLSRRAARRYARRAAIKTTGKRAAAHARARCRKLTARKRSCVLSWRSGRMFWSGKVRIESVLDGGVANFSYSARLHSRRRCFGTCRGVTRTRQGVEPV